MMIKKKHSFMLLLIVLLLGACRSKESSVCTGPPKGFSGSDLVGTWDAMDSLRDSTLIIRADGRYKQTMYVKRIGFRYESDWRPWRMTYSEKGLPYLHLEGLLMCAYWWQIDCSTGKTGIEPGGPARDIYGDASYWYDVCQKRWVETPGEGVFLVFGGYKYKQDPREIVLVPFTKSEGPNGPAYYLWEPVSPTSTPEPLSTSAAGSTSPSRPTPDLTHCIDAAPGSEAQSGTLTPQEWTATREPEAAQAASDGSCIKFGEKKYVKHSIGTRIVRGGSQGGIYVVWAPNPLGLVMSGLDWVAQVIGTPELGYLKRQGDKLYPENSTIPVLQDLGNDTYIALVNFYEEVLP